MDSMDTRWTGILEIILSKAASTPRNRHVFTVCRRVHAGDWQRGPPARTGTRWQNVVRRNRVRPRLREPGRDNNNNTELGPAHILQLSTCPARLDESTTTTTLHHIIICSHSTGAALPCTNPPSSTATRSASRASPHPYPSISISGARIGYSSRNTRRRRRSTAATAHHPRLLALSPRRAKRSNASTTLAPR